MIHKEELRCMNDGVASQELCHHHWVIETPNGPTSVGVCKICGLRQEFRNSITGSGWDRERAQARRAKR